MHEQAIIDSIIKNLDITNCDVKCISLIVDSDNLMNRLTRDVQKGIRSVDVIERSMARIPLYQALNTIKIDTSNKTIPMISDEIKQL